jgi:ParB family transcriptional regulator, chromosome partitioning protein
MAKPPTLGSRFGKNIEAINQNHSDRPAEKTAQQKIDPSRIIPSIFQPRRYFDGESLLELRESIQQLGILEPLLVRATDEKSDKYELIAGERRWRCAKELQLKSVPIVIVELSDEEAYLAALHENSQREDLNPIDETEYILKLLGHWLKLEVEGVKSLLYRLRNQKASGNVSTKGESEEDKTLEIVTRVIGQIKKGLTPVSFVETRLPLLKLPEEILAAIRRGEIEYTKAKLIAKISDREKRIEILATTIKEQWSVKEIQNWLKEQNQGAETEETPTLRISRTMKKLKVSKAWENPNKWKKIQTLLMKIEQELSPECN